MLVYILYNPAVQLEKGGGGLECSDDAHGCVGFVHEMAYVCVSSMIRMKIRRVVCTAFWISGYLGVDERE